MKSLARTEESLPPKALLNSFAKPSASVNASIARRRTADSVSDNVVQDVVENPLAAFDRRSACRSPALIANCFALALQDADSEITQLKFEATIGTP